MNLVTLRIQKMLMVICYTFLAIGTMADSLWDSLVHPLTVTCSGGNTCDYPNSIDDGGYNNYIESRHVYAASNVQGIENDSQEFIVDLGIPILFNMIYLNNRCLSGNSPKYFGQMEIRISNDSTLWSLDASAYVISNIYDGGFFVIQLSTPARYIAIRRIGPNPFNSSDNRFYLS